MATQEQAESDIYTLINTAWLAGTTAIVGYIPELRYPDTPNPAVPDRTKAYGRVTLKQDTNKQVTLSRPAKFQTSGIVYVQIFVPSAYPKNSRELTLQLGELAKSAYEGRTSPNGVWFQNVLVKTMPSETLWNSRMVQARYLFEYLKTVT